jgi:hypothetical protein
MSSQLSAQWAEPRFGLEPALQQASALPTEPRCTLTEQRCTLNEPRCTLTEACCHAGGRFPHLAYLHRGDPPEPPPTATAAAAAAAAVPLVRASHTVAGWRNGDDEKLMGAVLGPFRQERI